MMEVTGHKRCLTASERLNVSGNLWEPRTSAALATRAHCSALVAASARCLLDVRPGACGKLHGAVPGTPAHPGAPVTSVYSPVSVEGSPSLSLTLEQGPKRVLRNRSRRN